MSRNRQFRHPLFRWLSGALAVLTGLLSLATASPALHDWLHGGEPCKYCCNGAEEKSPDSEEPQPVCPVAILDMGATGPTGVESLRPTQVVPIHFPIRTERLQHGRVPLRFKARAPPTVNVV